MRGRFKPPLRPEDIAEVLRKGRMHPFGGGYYFEHGNVGLILKSRINAECDFYVTTIMNLKREPFKAGGLSRSRRSPFRGVVILNQGR